MNILPLFPLNTVIFPGTPLELHIFEERYKLMINRCLQEQNHFGVVLIAAGQEASGPLAEPFSIGCIAQITHTEFLDQGHLNLKTVGIERFRITKLLYTEPYLQAHYELYPLQQADNAKAAQALTLFKPKLEKYLSILAEIGELEIDFSQMPQNIHELCYIASFILQIPSRQKQQLLEAATDLDLITQLNGLYRKESAIFKKIAEQKIYPTNSLFSNN
jgi:uncharacterized protein